MPKKILVAEDHDESRFFLVKFIQNLGYEVIEATTGTEAVTKAIAEEPKLIFMDLGMPKLTGLDAARVLTKNPITAHIPIIAYSAWNVAQFERQTQEAGIVAYLEKPVSMDLIRSTIEKFIK
jgi:CheY-like chemotaxis protein